MIGHDARHGSRALRARPPRAARAPACARPAPAARCRRRCSPSPCASSAAPPGVMVTASHNPPQDNGYKVYLARRRADHPAARRADRRGDRRGRPGRPTCPLGDGGDAARRRRSPTHYLDAICRAPAAARASATCGSSTRRCTASARDARAARARARRVRGAARRSPSRPSRIRTSRPSRSPTPRSPARWTSRSRSRSARRRPRARQRSRRRPARGRDPGDRRRLARGCTGNEVGALLADYLLERAERDRPRRCS